MNHSASELVIDPALIRKYDVSGPRYTSYPTADRFVPAFGAGTNAHWLGHSSVDAIGRPLSLYVHLPFCNTVCFYCACNKIVTGDDSRSARYVRYLDKEIGLVASLIGSGRSVSQMHWGGGTPTFLSRVEMLALTNAVDAWFARSADCENSIEVDPRTVEPGMMAFLADLGFNRVSIGVQDFDPSVQQAVHRIQSESETRRVIEDARAGGFGSINVDLIYGLPKQTATSFDATIEQVLALVPTVSPCTATRTCRNASSRSGASSSRAATRRRQATDSDAGHRRLTDAGYVYIGMDHFAQPGDALAVAQREGRCSATSRATRRERTATCSVSVSRPSAVWARLTARTARKSTAITPRSTAGICP